MYYIGIDIGGTGIKVGLKRQLPGHDDQLGHIQGIAQQGRQRGGQQVVSALEDVQRAHGEPPYVFDG